MNDNQFNNTKDISSVQTNVDQNDIMIFQNHNKTLISPYNIDEMIGKTHSLETTKVEYVEHGIQF